MMNRVLAGLLALLTLPLAAHAQVQPAAPLASKGYVDTQLGTKLPLAGGALTGGLSCAAGKTCDVSPLSVTPSGSAASSLSSLLTYTPRINSGVVSLLNGPTIGTYQNGKFTSQPDEVQSAGTVAAGVCDTGKWTGFAGNTFSPLFACSAVKSSPTITNAYPGVVGIGDGSATAVPVNDPNYLQRAAHLVQAKTALDNTKQETGLGVNFISASGGGGLPVTNHNQKVGLSVFALAVPGAANTWAVNTDFHVNAGVGNYSAFGREADHTNFNGDYKPGGCGGTCPTGQIDGNFFGDFMTFTGKPITAGTVYTGTAETGSKNMYFGILFQPEPGFTAVGTGLISDATILDTTNAATSYQIKGNHTVGVGTTLATLPYAFISAAGQATCFNALAGCFTYDTSKAGLSYNSGKVVLSDAGTVSATAFAATGTATAFLGNSRGGGFSVSDAGGAIANLINVQPSTAGFGPAIQVTGSDANVPLNVYAKGTGQIALRANATTFGTHTVTGLTMPAQFAVASLPACNAAAKGGMAVATDVSAAPTYRQTGLAGGGTIAVPVFCNGSAWEAH
jgi:hypothetical protein